MRRRLTPRHLINVRTPLHIDDTALEDAARFGLMDSPAFAQIRQHVSHCTECQDRFAEVNEYERFRLAGAEEESRGQALSRRDTREGTVFLLVHGDDLEGWEGRAIGGGHFVKRSFAKGSDARQWLEQWFGEACEGTRFKTPRLTFRDTEGAGSCADRSTGGSSSQSADLAVAVCR